MDLTLTPFNPSVLRQKHRFVTFTESGIDIIILTPEKNKINSGNRYMFGTLKDGKPYWFFSGKSIANSRDMMKDIYFELKQNFTGNNQHVFIFKGNLYGSRI